MNPTPRVLASALLALSLLVLPAPSRGAEPVSMSSLADRIVFPPQPAAELGFDKGVLLSGQTEAEPLRIADKEYAKGLGMPIPGEVVFWLGGEYETFTAEFGLPPAAKSVPPAASGVFEVYADSERRFTSGSVMRSDGPRAVRVSVKGATLLRLTVKEAFSGLPMGAAVWGDACLVPDAAPRRVSPKRPQYMPIAAFADVVTCDPGRTEGVAAGRMEEFPAEDISLEKVVLCNEDGAYTAPVYDGQTACIGLRWAERRMLRELGLRFKDPARAPSPTVVKVQCWKGASRWQGKWEDTKGSMSAEQGRLVFAPEAMAPTDKVRWVFPATEGTQVDPPVAVSQSICATSRFWLEFENPAPKDPVEIEVYNGYLENGSKTGSGERRTWKAGQPLSLDICYTLAPRVPDRTVVRVSLPGKGVGVALDDVLLNGCVYVPACGLFVTPVPARTTLAKYKEAIQGQKTVLERAEEMPDQTLDAVRSRLAGIVPSNDPVMLSLACANEKFVVAPKGGVQFDVVDELGRGRYGAGGWDGDHVPGPPTGWVYCSSEVRPVFGAGQAGRRERHLEDSWMPVPVISLSENGLVYHQRTFVAPLSLPSPNESLFTATLNSVCVMEIAIENPQVHAVDASLTLAMALDRKKKFAPPYDPEAGCLFKTETEATPALQAVSNGALALRKDGTVFAYVDLGGSSGLQHNMGDGAVRLAGAMGANTTQRCTVYIPGWAASWKEVEGLRNRGEELLANTRAYWERVMAPAMQVDIPDPALRNTIIASQVHCLLVARNASSGRYVAPWIAAMAYGPLDTEGQAVIYGMDLFGHCEFARRALDCYVKDYNPDGLLSKGYTVMGTGQHLWVLANHYQLSQDREWLRQVAPNVTKSCQWILRQRTKTMRTDPRGERVPEWGLAPPGVLADWGRYAYYFYANAHFCHGVRAVAEALAGIGAEGAGPLASAAAAYQDDILSAFRWNRARMPVLPLTNGTWVPSYASSLYSFGQTRDFEAGLASVGHDVEVGSQHLISNGVMDANSPEARWVADYMEDYWFFEPGFFGFSENYGVKPPAATEEALRQEWFTFGGYSKQQPYYTRITSIYALRDDVKPFIRSYFNTFPLSLSSETLAFWEQPPGLPAWGKTHETGWFLEATRLMFVMERGGALWLAPFVTSNWLKDGQHVAISSAPTRFGNVSYCIESHADEGYIEADVKPPARNAPRELVIRLRHPDGMPIRSAWVNGAAHTDFDPARSAVRVVKPQGELHIKAVYQN